MPPATTRPSHHHASHLILSLLSVASSHVPRILHALGVPNSSARLGAAPHRLAKREERPEGSRFIVFACLIPVLVLLSGLFAGLTLGYMSLDETQLNVLSISGTPLQKHYANRIKPIRKNGHLLLVTLLLANMIVNETLPVIADPILGGGFQSVVVSTVLIVIFAEVIPQSVCTRYGLAVGGKMAPFVKVLLCTLGIFAWPVAKLLEFTLGPHHGIIYRRSELKELIHIHADSEAHGGDLKTDTVAIIGATLDLQEKVVKHAMTPIKDVFMLSINSVLDWDTLRRISLTGHSRVPVYEEVEAPFGYGGANEENMRMERVKKIVGILLVKQCVLLDPNDAIPLRKIPLNKVPFVPQNEPLLGILDRFQEGRSHMAIVTRFSKEEAASVKKVVKSSLTQRIRNRVGMGDMSDSSSEDEGEQPTQTKEKKSKGKKKSPSLDLFTHRGDTREKEDSQTVSSVSEKSRRGPDRAEGDIEIGLASPQESKNRASFQLPRVVGTGLEQAMPADAVLGKQGAEEFLQSFDPAVAPLGIITLEDVLEELIGEEIYDEFDPEVAQHFASFVPPPSPTQDRKGAKPILKRRGSAPDLYPTEPKGITLLSSTFDKAEGVAPAVRVSKTTTSTPVLRPMALPGLSTISALPGLPGIRHLNLFGSSGARSRSAPPTRRNSKKGATVDVGRPRTPATPGSDPVPVQELRISEEAYDGTIMPLEEKGSTNLLLGMHDSVTPPAATTPVASTTERPGVTFVEPATGGHVQIHAPAPAIPGNAAASLVVPHASRNGSPAPSLEAFLLGSKRRHHQREVPGGSEGGPAATKERASSTFQKGTRFKSSPLMGERVGVVAGRVGGAWYPTDGDKGEEPALEYGNDGTRGA